MPRRLLSSVGFEHLVGVVEEAPPAIARYMKANDDGKVLGDVFQFDRTRVGELIQLVEAYSAQQSDGFQVTIKYYGTKLHLQLLRECAGDWSS